MGALLYLTICSSRNRVLFRLRRLRQARYAIGLLVGIGYFVMILRPGRRRNTGLAGLAAAAREPLALAASLVLFVIVALAWLWPSKETSALSFTRADVQFLFPAPISRRQLIVYKLARMQIGALVSSAIMTLFFRPGTLAAGWTFFVGFSLATSIVIVHLTAVSLSRTSVLQHGRAGLARQWLPLLLVIGSAVVLGQAVLSAWPHLAGLRRPGAILTELHRITSTGLPAVVLWPFRAVVRLPLAGSATEFLRALPAALVIYALNFAWAVRSDAAFEEASAELAEKVARIRQGAQPIAGTIRKRPAPFALATSGHAEVALLWKNLIMFGRYATLRRAVFFLPAAIIMGVSLGARRTAAADGLGVLCLIFAVLTVFIGPLMMRNDLRRDLERLAVLKTWPVRGAVLVRGEALAPAAVLTVVAWILILGTATSSSHLFQQIGIASLRRQLSFTAAALLIAPGLIATQVLVQNAVAILFPSWVSIGPSRAQGLDVMGQRMLMMAAMLVTLVFAVLPAALLAGVVAAAIYFVTSIVPVVLPAAIITAMLVAECLLASEALGRVMERTDPSAIDAVE